MGRGNMNAKEEFLSSIGTRHVKCAIIDYSGCSLWELEDEQAPASQALILKVGYNETAWEEFLEKLNFEYDAGYGGQELFGTVWFSASDAWLTRWEYDGSEGWQINSRPEIPDELF
jgi:hypothetical protein